MAEREGCAKTRYLPLDLATRAIGEKRKLDQAARRRACLTLKLCPLRFHESHENLGEAICRI
jgi:hypothetical protein